MPLSGFPVIAAFERARRRQARILDEIGDEDDSIIEVEVDDLPNSTRSEDVPARGEEHNYCSVLRPTNPQNVLTISKRAAIVRWMAKTVEEQGEKHIASKAVRQFPESF